MGVCAYAVVLCGCASAWACVLIAAGLSTQASTALSWSSCSTSPGSHRDVSVKALEQVHLACPEPAWQRISSVPYAICRWVIQSWVTEVRTLPKGWSTEKTLNQLQISGVSCCLQNHHLLHHFKSDFWRISFFQEVLIPLILVAKAICFASFLRHLSYLKQHGWVSCVT